MTDVHNPATRQKNMSAIRNKDTKPERIVAGLLSDMNIEFVTQKADIPGKPDIYVPQYQCSIFVHGCFWHGHDCHLFKVPQTRTEFWMNKINSNRSRDQNVRAELKAQNLRQLIVWECSLKGSQKLKTAALGERIEEFLLSNVRFAEIRETGFATAPTIT